ncbi:hypothetical protein L226DRAFT_110250 [Lentinus tigrinus ALCF2SS1-7]|uniref:uncharacterized protein n=1 Tax=Lentinus tigrinus ALCF2SS1-7 TaxID=1328758 RepID=UPI00116637F5|nr:hypothetical protein L226DRAFT_110250 [Lentinus tigrinus ALCF2SS1-7]
MARTMVHSCRRRALDCPRYGRFRRRPQACLSEPCSVLRPLLVPQLVFYHHLPYQSPSRVPHRFPNFAPPPRSLATSPRSCATLSTY